MTNGAELELRRRMASRGVRERARARVDAKVVGSYPTRAELTRSSVFVDSLALLPQHWHQRVAALEITVTPSRRRATVFVTSDPWRPPGDDCMLCCAAWRGAWIGTPALLDEPPSGPCRKLKAAMSTPRRLFTTNSFRNDHARQWVCTLELSVTAHNHQWHVLESNEAWAAAKARAIKAKTSAGVLCIVSAAEAPSNANKSQHIFGFAGFVEFITRSDEGLGALGIANL